MASTSTLDRTGRRACAPWLALFALLILPAAADAQDCGRPVSPPSSRPGDQFGCSVASDGITAAVGANLADSGGVTDSGAVFVFDSLTGPFVTLTAPTPEEKAEFGFATAVDGGRVAVGAPLADVGTARGAGAVYVFERPPNGAFGSPEVVTALDAATDARFGQALALRGDLLVVGAPFDPGRGSRAGALYVFRRQDGKWRQQAKLIAKTTRPFDGFGFVVALGPETLVVGAPFRDGRAGGQQGAAYVFRRAGTTWEEEAELTSVEAGVAAIAGEEFGSAVALDGTRLAVGARRRPVDGKANAGALFIFARERDGWRPEPGPPLVARPAQAGELLGGAVLLDGERLVAGAIGHGDHRGAAYVFARSPATGRWEEGPRLTVPPTAPRDRFGQAFAVFEGRLLTGAYLADPEGKVDAGAVFDCLPSGRDPLEITKESLDPALPGRRLTYSVEVTGAPPGTVVREEPQRGLVDLEWCRNAGCTDFAGGLLADTLAAGGAAAYRVRGLVPANACGAVVNRASATPPGGAAVRAETVDFLPRADVSVVVRASATRGCPGDTLTYTVEVRNRGERAAAGVDVTATPGGPISEDVTLPPRGTASYSLQAELPAVPRVCASVPAAACDRSGGDDCARADVVVEDCPPSCTETPVLVVTIPPLAGAAAGTTVDVPVRVRNEGPCRALGTFLAVAAPGLELVDARSVCPRGTGNFWLGRLEEGEFCDVTVTLRILCSHSAGAVPIAATADAANAAPSSDTEPLPVRVETDYAISWTGPPSASAGVPFSYEIAVTNHGPSCPEAVVEVDLDPELTGGPLPTAATPQPPAPGKPPVPQVFRFDVQTSPLFTGSVTSDARVRPLSGADPVDGNNKATITTPVSAPPGLHAHCLWPPALEEGGAAALSFLLVNGGPLDLTDDTGPEFEVSFDPELVLVSGSATKGTAAAVPPMLTWDGALPGSCPPEAPGPCRVEITGHVTVGPATAGQTLCAAGPLLSCCAVVLPAGALAEIPAAGPAALALLALLLALAALRVLRGC